MARESGHPEGYYKSTETGKAVPIWVPAKVVRVADGMTDKGADGKQLSKWARTIAPRGMLLVEWEADADRGHPEAYQAWYMLDPRKWAEDHAHKGWRWHPDELARILAAKKGRSGAGCSTDPPPPPAAEPGSSG